MMKQQRSKAKRRGSQIPRSVRMELSDGPSYAGQQMFRIKLPSAPSLETTIVTSGLIAQAIPVQSSLITGFAARFGSTFDEYRILGADVHVRPLATSTGVSIFWFDEKSNASPTANESLERNRVVLPNTNANVKADRTVRWRARDLLDLQYTAIGTSVNPVTFKVYTDAANWGAPIAATGLWVIELTLTIEFRGLKST